MRSTLFSHERSGWLGFFLGIMVDKFFFTLVIISIASSTSIFSSLNCLLCFSSRCAYDSGCFLQISCLEDAGFTASGTWGEYIFWFYIYNE